MKLVIAVVLMVTMGVMNAMGACLQPQLGIWQVADSEDGKKIVRVLYEVDHTFKMSWLPKYLEWSNYEAVRNPSKFVLPEVMRTNYGTWGIGQNCEFWWVETLGQNAGVRQTKNNGHGIGRTILTQGVSSTISGGSTIPVPVMPGRE